MSVAGRTPQDIVARSNYFKEMIEIQLASPSCCEANLYFHTETPNILAHIYFALTNAYKEIHIKPGNRTDKAKRAALTCATIAALAPLRPDPNKNSLDSDAELYCNPMLAMRCSCSIVQHVFYKRPFDDQRRIYKALISYRLDCVDAAMLRIRQDQGIIDYDLHFDLSSEDDSKLSLMVNDFVMYSYLTHPIQWDR